jgi:Domain of unknown function (DUF4388)
MHNRFVVLTGHLNDYPLSDLVGILRHQGKTGRLLIEYPKGPASFFFRDGSLVDAQLGNLVGLQAVCVALAQPAAPFNFNPLILPSRRSIESSLQRVVSELLGCWDEDALEIDTVATSRTLPGPAPLALPTSTSVDRDEAISVKALCLPAVVEQRPGIGHGRAMFAIAAAGLMMLGLSTVIAVTGSFAKRALLVPSLPAQKLHVAAPETSEARRSTPSDAGSQDDSRVQRYASSGREAASVSGRSGRREGRFSSTGKIEKAGADSGRAPVVEALSLDDRRKPKESGSNIESVKVIMRVEKGRVIQASIANHRSGMDAYEATALRIARERRYGSATAGQESITIKVTQPN